MKKVLSLFILLLACLLFSACSAEYKGKEITKITYTSIDYMGGIKHIYTIDLEKNVYQKSVNGEEIEDFETKKTFSDEDEKVFLDGIYSLGFFSLKKEYKPIAGIDDGGGWNLEIIYKDGSKKVSTGDNAWPTLVFNKCSTYFYDLCGERVLGNLPKYYDNPPQVDVYFQKDEYTSSNGYTRVVKTEYKWNRQNYVGDVFSLCSAYETEFDNTSSYTLIFYTANYDYSVKFKNCKVYSYDYNSELTNEKLIAENGWFKQIEFSLELDKIYVFELSYANGDYVKYAFSTMAK